MMGGMMPKKTKLRHVKVKEARKLLTAEEAEKLIDEDAVKEEAVRRCEQSGIVFLDEIDKIAGRGAGTGPDVSREGVRRDILPIVEGSTVKPKYGPVRTDFMLFIGAGAGPRFQGFRSDPRIAGTLPRARHPQKPHPGGFRRRF